MGKIDLFIKALENSNKVLYWILCRMDDKLKLSTKAKIRGSGQRLVIKNWYSAKEGGFVSMAHIQRYEWVLPYVKDCYCLDDGCGSGYGTNYLANNGVSNIIGIDKYKEIKYVKKWYQRENLEFRYMDGCNLKFGDNTFDAIISFDVLEHTRAEDQEKFISETARTLKPEGTLYIGCPNATVSMGNNPHHFKELTRKELECRLQKYYGNVKILGQDISINGVKQKEHWYKYLSKLSYYNLVIIEEDYDFAYGLLAICKKPKKSAVRL